MPGDIELPNILDLIRAEGWECDGRRVKVYGQELPVMHPAGIHLWAYRTSQNPEVKYQHLKAAHDYLWPEEVETWNYWSERRFRAHCEGWDCIGYAGGAGTGKSYDAARLAVLFWLANPKKRAVLVMSTTLEALSSRIYGYVLRFAQKMAVEFPIKIRSGNTEFIEYEGRKDKLHTIKAVAAKQGDSEAKISSLIGRHPEEGLLVVMDEATDLPVELLAALPNLKSVPTFQAMAIGNSNSRFDLHGSICTPANGWDSINPMEVNRWETTQENGVCLFFSCYESPAIFETDPVRKSKLSRIFITSEKINKAEKLYGKESDSFWRFILGYWRSEIHDETVVSRKFLNEFHVRNRAEWSGYRPLATVAGLDPAFSQGGDQCLLRLAVLGQSVDGKILLDFKGDKLLFKIGINAKDNRSAELQIADQVIKILEEHGVELGSMAVDSNGQGRAIGELIWLRAKAVQHPLKIYSVRQGNKAVRSFDVVIKTNFELWAEMRKFIETDQIRGLDEVALAQLSSRLIVVKNGKQILEQKQEYKLRMGAINPILAHSPDEADSCALALQAAILVHGFHPGQTIALPVEDFEFEKKEAWLLARVQEQGHPEGAGGAVKEFSGNTGFNVGLDDSIVMGGQYGGFSIPGSQENR